MPWPSYIDGCYPLVGRPRYPELWDGCIGAWCPSLGPTGLTLHDMSPYHHDGTLTNMDTAQDWTISGGQYALDLDGSNDYVSVANSEELKPPTMTISAWLNLRTINTALSGGIGKTSTSSWADGWGLDVYTGRTNIAFWVNSYLSGAAIAAFSTNVWTHVCGTYDLRNVTLYINGVSQASIAYTSALKHTSSPLYIGALGTSSFLLNGLFDDVRYYKSALRPESVRLLARRRGIAYEMEPHSRTVSQQAAFQAAWAHRRRLLIGAGTL